MTGVHILALILCISGTGAVIGAVISNEWKVTSRATSVITATWVFQGLWMNCAGNALGSYHCRPHLTLFRVEGLCSLTACSIYAHKTTSEFFDPSIPQKYELGPALFMGWAGAAVCLIGGSIFCATIIAGSNLHSRPNYSHAGLTMMTSRPEKPPAYQKSTFRSSNEFNKTAYV
ncbi:claudin-10 isoform X2 [Pelobates cultripes]|uniref:Claudin n=1 Tax=Pelobates cultripes TaxID=61616 RepID=A0AAD1R4D8_PELCU|nr:claudin-10 isoform X2 [Pelobates cultripes]